MILTQHAPACIVMIMYLNVKPKPRRDPARRRERHRGPETYNPRRTERERILLKKKAEFKIDEKCLHGFK